MAGLLLVLLAAVFVYRDIAGHALVWDDWSNFGRDRGYEAGGLEALRFALREVRLGHYQPLAWLSFSLDHSLFGDDLPRYRWTNLALHLLNSCLVWALAQRLFARVGAGKGRALAAVAAVAWFALHPMRVETVAWLTERRHLLASSFALASALCYVRSVAGVRVHRLWMAGSAALYAASLLATPLAYGLPFVFLLLDRYPMARSGSFAPRDLKLLEKLPFLVLLGLFTWTALGAQDRSGALIGLESYGPDQRLAQAAYGFGFYPRALFHTAWLPLYERPSRLDPTELRFVLSGIAVVVTTVAVWMLRRRSVAPAAAWLSYLVLLAPVSGLAQSGSQLVADRYSYLATLPLVFLAAGGLALAPMPRGLRGGLGVIGLVLALGWTHLSREQVGVWRDDSALWSHVVAHEPSGIGHNNLATIAEREGNLDEAVRQIASAVRTTPTYGRAWRTARRLLEAGGRLDPEAVRELDRALDAALPTQPSGLARYIAGLAAARANDLERAIVRFEEATDIRADFGPAWQSLGMAAFASGDTARARRAFIRALEIEPTDPVSRSWLARIGDGPD